MTGNRLPKTPAGPLMISALFLCVRLRQPPTTKLPPPMPVPVLVVDKDGKPVEGAEVFLAGRAPRTESLDFQVAATAKTDAQGRCSLDPSAQAAKPDEDEWIPPSSVWVYRPGF